MVLRRSGLGRGDTGERQSYSLQGFAYVDGLMDNVHADPELFKRLTQQGSKLFNIC